MQGNTSVKYTFLFFPTCTVLKNSSQLLGLRLIAALLTASLTPIQCWANLLWSTLVLNKQSLGSIRTVSEFEFEAFSHFGSSRAFGKMGSSICWFTAPEPPTTGSGQITGKRILPCWRQDAKPAQLVLQLSSYTEENRLCLKHPICLNASPLQTQSTTAPSLPEAGRSFLPSLCHSHIHVGISQTIHYCCLKYFVGKAMLYLKISCSQPCVSDSLSLLGEYEKECRASEAVDITIIYQPCTNKTVPGTRQAA